MCCRLITFQDGERKIGLRDKSGWGVYASVSCSLVLNVPELREEVNSVLGGCVGGVRGVCVCLCSQSQIRQLVKNAELSVMKHGRQESLHCRLCCSCLGKSRTRSPSDTADASLWHFKLPQKTPQGRPRTPEPSPPCLLSSCGRWAVHLKAGTASTSGWDLLLEAHSSNLHFQCPSSIKSHCFWLFRQCQLSCIPLFSVNIFTFVTPNWLNTTQHFEENSTSTWIKCNTLTISYKHSKLTAMGAGEAGDMNLDQGLHRFIGKAFCESSPGAHTTVDWVTKVTHYKKVRKPSCWEFQLSSMALEEVGTPCCNSSPEDDHPIPHIFPHQS